MRSGSVLLAALLLTGLTGLTTATATAEPPIAWDDCENTAVQCATVTVPIDYANPSTGTIDVHIARIPAKGRKQGTVFYLPGGPGDSGVGRLQSPDVVPKDVLERFDVVSFDPRGTNRSHPVVCDAGLLSNFWQLNVVPDAGARLTDVQAYARDLGDSCREHTGPLIDHIDNVSVARDIDTIRAALGERQLTLYGRSYGTLAGQMYAENFPHRVRGLVLDSVFDHSLPVSRMLTQQAATAEDSFHGFARWCAASVECALHGRDVGQVYDDLYARAVDGDLSLSPMRLNQEIVQRHLYEPNWPGTADRLVQLAGEPAPARTTAATARFPVAAVCADHRVRFSSQARWASSWREMNAAAPTLHGHFLWLLVSVCSGWPAATPNPQHPTDLDRRVPPVLIMNGLHDPATSHTWARSVNRQLDRSVLLTYDGWGHGVSNRTECTKEVFSNYVLHGRTPRPGTHCPA